MNRHLCIGGGNNHNWESSGLIEVEGKEEVLYTCKDCGLKGSQTYIIKEDRGELK